MSDLPVLDAEDQRILGSLLEKQTTVPATYPLTANALRSACNQTNSRDPVTDYDEQTVQRTAKSLKDRGLLRIVWSDTGRRTLKYHQILDEHLGLEPDERALVTVLLLRGAQAPGELKTRTERLHPFADRGEVEACLHRMASRAQPLVRELDRQPGQHDRRWIHLLGDDVTAPGADAGHASVRTSSDTWLEDTRGSYDADADAYADKVRGLLEASPYLRAGLSMFAELVRDAGGGPVADVGCGPGYVTRHLHDLGLDAFGIDLSPEMVAVARRDHPDLRFEVGTMTDLDLADDSVTGVLAFWSVIHVPDDAVPGVFEGFHRVLRPGCPVLVGFHVGDTTRHTSEGYSGRPVNVDSHRRRPELVARWLREAGFTIEAQLLTRPDDEVPGAMIIARSDARH